MGKAEILHEIKVAEEKIRAMANEAEEKRKQLQAEGKRKAIERIDVAESELRKKLDIQLADAQAQIEKKKKALLDESSKKADKFASNARQNMGRAKEFVLTEFERAVDA